MPFFPEAYHQGASREVFKGGPDSDRLPGMARVPVPHVTAPRRDYPSISSLNTARYGGDDGLESNFTQERLKELEEALPS